MTLLLIGCQVSLTTLIPQLSRCGCGCESFASTTF